MTDIHFYHNAEDLLGVACHLAVRAFRSGRKVAVLLPDEAIARQLDQLLWTRPPMDFLPHTRFSSPLAADTPITLGDTPPAGGWPHDDVLINLAADVPPGYERFKMVVEVVGTDEAHKVPARNRWRHYAGAGLTPTAHNTASS
ncbi:DNA polymerase III subunit chi [Denitromonas sp.]|uniref:DNA polymerase III subunit chi n=1 Tax=Denitromonas sp. TaxID=2734609 RepID=UPI003A8B3A94